MQCNWPLVCTSAFQFGLCLMEIQDRKRLSCYKSQNWEERWRYLGSITTEHDKVDACVNTFGEKSISNF